MQTLKIVRHPQWVEVTLARPAVRNAMSFEMVDELRQTFRSLRDDHDTQAVVLRGAGGHFCAGGDVKDMREILASPSPSSDTQASDNDGGSPVEHNPLAQANRTFGEMLSEIEGAPQVVIVVLEGAVMGGGFGLACVADIALALPSARFGLPEVTLGLTPAQIAPFVVARVGSMRARQLALTGARFDAEAARSYGLVHACFANETELNQHLSQTLVNISNCAPEARRATKELILSAGNPDRAQLLDHAALGFAHAVREGEGMAGMMAFITKQSPAWQQAWGNIAYGQPPEDEPGTKEGGGS